jgi:hypothetical protein
MSGHFRDVCEFGFVHRQCRCPSTNKTEHSVKCDRPSEHDLVTSAPILPSKPGDFLDEFVKRLQNNQPIHAADWGRYKSLILTLNRLLD